MTQGESTLLPAQIKLAAFLLCHLLLKQGIEHGLQDLTMLIDQPDGGAFTGTEIGSL
jgi:hypothetical protein